MNSLHGHNLTEPHFEGAKYMLYFEKHNLFEISRHLLLRLGICRTIDVKGFIRANIRKIANEVNTKHSIVVAPSVFGRPSLLSKTCDIEKWHLVDTEGMAVQQICDGDPMRPKSPAPELIQRKHIIFYGLSWFTFSSWPGWATMVTEMRITPILIKQYYNLHVFLNAMSEYGNLAKETAEMTANLKDLASTIWLLSTVSSEIPIEKPYDWFYLSLFWPTMSAAFNCCNFLSDCNELASYMQTCFNIPTIVYTKERKPCDGYEILRKFKKLLKHLSLERKNIMFVNFPSNRVECLYFRKEHFNPNYVFEIQSSFQIPFKTKKMLEDEGAPYIEKLNQLKNFYGNVFRVINFGIADEPDGSLNCAKNAFHQTIEEVGLDLIKMMRNIQVNKDEVEAGTYLPRIVMFGRRGSGRRTQAKELANLFGLVLVDVQQLILETMKEDSGIAESLREAAKSHEYSEMAICNIVQKRLLEKDCTKSGWVLVGYPNDVNGFKNMDRHLVPPNKIIFLHCRERVALRRLQKLWQRNAETKSKPSPKEKCPDNNLVIACIEQHKANDEALNKYLPKDKCFPSPPKPQGGLREQFENLAKREFLMFNLAKKDVLEYMSRKRETIHIDGNHTRKTVATEICARVEQQQNSFGKLKKHRARKCMQ